MGQRLCERGPGDGGSKSGPLVRELEIIGARVYERRDFERAVQMLAAGEIPAAQLISAVEPLERAAEAFSALESGGEVMKVLIHCREE